MTRRSWTRPLLRRTWHRIATGEDPRAVADELGVTLNALGLAMRRNGLSMRDAQKQGSRLRWEAAALDVAAGLDVKAAALEHGVAQRDVTATCRRLGISPPLWGRRRQERHEADREAYLLRLQGLEVREIAERLGVDRSRIYQRLWRYQRVLGNQTEAA